MGGGIGDFVGTWKALEEPQDGGQGRSDRWTCNASFDHRTTPRAVDCPVCRCAGLDGRGRLRGRDAGSCAVLQPQCRQQGDVGRDRPAFRRRIREGHQQGIPVGRQNNGIETAGRGSRQQQHGQLRLCRRRQQQCCRQYQSRVRLETERLCIWQLQRCLGRQLLGLGSWQQRLWELLHRTGRHQSRDGCRLDCPWISVERVGRSRHRIRQCFARHEVRGHRAGQLHEGKRHGRHRHRRRWRPCFRRLLRPHGRPGDRRSIHCPGGQRQRVRHRHRGHRQFVECQRYLCGGDRNQYERDRRERRSARTRRHGNRDRIDRTGRPRQCPRGRRQCHRKERTGDQGQQRGAGRGFGDPYGRIEQLRRLRPVEQAVLVRRGERRQPPDHGRCGGQRGPGRRQCPASQDRHRLAVEQHRYHERQHR
jgi:hypothetical protein